MIKKLKDT